MRHRCLLPVPFPMWVVVLFAFSGCQQPATLPTPDAAPSPFVNFESPHVSPVALTPDGALLLAVNTADNAIEVFDVTGETPAALGRVPVGLEPVSVRAPSSQEAWVVNRVSDSVSVVDLTTRTVVRTLRVADEPGDVSFGGGRAFVSCLEPSRVLAYDLQNLDAEPAVIAIEARDPRAMAASADGSRIYVAIFESGNHTTVLDQHVASLPEGPYGGHNPPPNGGDAFVPPIAADLPGPPQVSRIVGKDPLSGAWLDDNGRNWSDFVGWDLHDRDVAVIDTSTLAVSYLTGLMNVNMHLASRSDGLLVVVGTEATNVIRFEPNLTGRFVRTVAAVVDPSGNPAIGPQIVDLNPHLASAYEQNLKQVPAEARALSVSDPRGMVWQSDGAVGYITGMGSDNLVAIDAAGGRLGQVDLGAGPTGLALDESKHRLYVLNRFDATLSVVDTASLTEVTRVAMFDPTPAEVKVGRPFLYDARRTSGLGVTSCASCHVDGRMDGLAWDLGDPGGQMLAFDQTCDNLNGLLFDAHCEDFHPMKGPMVTQSLQSIIGTEPLHWRGDRASLSHFSGAFVNLLGGEQEPTEEEMSQFRAFLSTIKYPPNPHRNLDDSLKGWLIDGSPAFGESVFTTGNHDRNRFNCNFCHSGSTGTNQKITPGSELDGVSVKVAQLRGIYKKTGFRKDSLANDRGFGFTHDGRFATIPEFLHFRVFTFPRDESGEQQRRDLAAFLMSFPGDAHPAVGTQVTLGAAGTTAETESLLALMLTLADSGKTGLVVHGRVGGSSRGYAYRGANVFQSDRASEQMDASVVRSLAGPGAEQTWTVVPLGSETRIGVDHDQDGILDGDAVSASN